MGVCVFLALPGGVPGTTPAENRLAARTEDHPLEYLDFEGDIPRASTAPAGWTIWNAGTYDAEKCGEERKVVITLHRPAGPGPQGLFQTDGDWIIHRFDPPPRTRSAARRRSSR